MKATVTRDGFGKPDNDSSGRFFAPGETIYGDLAAVAVREGWAEAVAESAPAPAAPKAKRARKR